MPVGTLHDAVPDGKPRAVGERRNARRAAQQRVVAAQDVRLRVDAPPRTTARLARNKGAEVLLVALGAGPFTCAAPCSIVSARVTRHPSPYATASSHVTHVTLSPATRSAVCQPGDRDMCTPPADKRDGPLGHASVPAAHHNPAPVPNNNGVRPVVHGERKRRTGRPNNAPDAPVKVDACRCDADGCVGAATDKRLAGRADDRRAPIEHNGATINHSSQGPSFLVSMVHNNLNKESFEKPNREPNGTARGENTIPAGKKGVKSHGSGFLIWKAFTRGKSFSGGNKLKTRFYCVFGSS